ncbi:MAG: ASKHA domain-containing protein [Pseudomonadota bacterium]
MAYDIIFEPSGLAASLEEGESLLVAAVRAGVYLPALCGGEGSCGKCRVEVVAGKTAPLDRGGERERLETGAVVWACRTVARSDLVLRVPEAARLDRRALERTGARRQAAELVELPAGGRPLVEKADVVLPSPSPQDNVADETRLARGLKAKGYRLAGVPGLALLKGLSAVSREGGWQVTASLERHGAGYRLLRVEPGDTAKRNLAVAIDLGTTTVCGELLDLQRRRVLSRHAEYNPQMSRGEDVISRIVHSQRRGGLDDLRRLAVGIIEDVALALLGKARLAGRSVSCLVVAGNTTMAHLLCGLDPKYLREAPYVPASAEFPALRGADLGFERLGGHLLVRMLPAVASYVGGDIVSGVLATGMAHDSRLTLYVDIGTNGEIVVGNQDWLACASCSAGPAFEGGGIRCGIRATGGAIEEVRIHPETFEPMIITIGHGRPKGICGSGLLSLLAELFEVGLIDQRGRFKDVSTPRVRQGEGGGEYVLAWAPDSATGADLALSETDIDNLIRAKAAMYAGCLTLLEGVGLKMSDLERVIISGAFGSFINLEKAITIGLLPDLNPEKFFFVGNGSLSGAARVALCAEDYAESVRLAHSMTNFELSESPRFMENYMAALFLPHTETGTMFPTVAARLGLA